MKKIQFLFPLMLMALAILFSACSSDSFKIDGNIAHVEGAVRIIFQSDSGMVDELINLDKKGHFSFRSGRAHV